MIINYEILKRFINDCSIPMQVIKNDAYVNYMIDLLQPAFQTRTKWDNIQQLITEKFDNLPDKFLREFYQTRENIIKSIQNSDKFIEFNTGSMDRYKLIDLPKQVSKDNIYKSIHVGKTLLSIDLRYANYQALRFAGVFKEDTYTDFIRNFTDLDYIIDSKYLRSVIFGQLNPNRHISVEKYIIVEIYNYLIREKIIPEDFILLTLVNDELVFEVVGNTIPDATEIINKIKEHFDIIVKADYFKLNGLRLLAETSSRIIDFYEKDKKDGTKSLHCIPVTYFPIAYKLYNGRELEEFDTWFLYDGLISKLLEPFKLERYS